MKYKIGDIVVIKSLNEVGTGFRHLLGYTWHIKNPNTNFIGIIKHYYNGYADIRLIYPGIKNSYGEWLYHKICIKRKVNENEIDLVTAGLL